MNGLAQSVQWLWAISVGAQAAVLALLLMRGHFRRVPVFTIYVVVNLCQAGFVYFLYAHYGYSSQIATVLGWISQAVTLLAEALATMELLFKVLSRYQGISTFGWRVVVTVSLVMLGYVTATAGGNVAWALMEADRGYHLIFATAVIACLLLVRFYSVPIAPAYKALLAGFCIYSCTTILVNAVSEFMLYRRYANHGEIWQFATVLSYAVVQVVWAAALRKPIVAKSAEPFLFPAEIYRQLSPEINQNLRRLNEQLIRFWKPEAFRQ